MHHRFVSLLTLLTLTPAVVAQSNDGPRVELPGQIVVCFKTPDTAFELKDFVTTWEQATPVPFTIDSSRSLLQWQKRNESVITNVVLLKYSPASMPISALQAWLKDAEGVAWAAPNVGMTEDPREHTPNDPQYGSQYHHPLMQNNLAWDTTLGDPSIIVGVTDDGVDTDHQDLIANIWSNPGETPGDGIDNDNNGYIDDFQGFDFVFNNNDPNPNDPGNDHGTHVAGIVAADTDNNIGVAGTAGDATIMPLQFYASGQSWTAVNIADAFAYGTDNGARIITTSYNMDGWVGDPVVTAAFDYMYDNGVLHFNSAGNGNALNPARQAFTQSMLVASTDSGDVRSSFSNYGTGIDIAAPGSSVLSTILNDNYGVKSGTSMASPNAAGVAALIWSANPTWTSAQVAAQMSFTADNIDAQNPAYVGLLGGGRVNSFKALTQTLPAPRPAIAVGLPSEGGNLVGDLSSIQMTFDQILDPATVNQPNAFSLAYEGPDGVFGSADDVQIVLNAEEYLFAGNHVSMTVAGALPNAGRYRFSANASVLTNPFGTALDGNGDGTGGDDWTLTFNACGTLVLLEDNAESGTDWSVVNENLSTGAWTANPVVPTGGGLRSDPPTDYDGSGKCFVTQDGPGDTDVDGGPTRLISRAFDLSASPDPYLSFARWMVTNGDDVMDVHISNNNGGAWTLVETLTGSDGWEVESYRVADFVTPTALTRLRFSVADTGGGSVVEAGIDFLRVIEIDCNPAQAVGVSFCVGAPNSAGPGASISGVGSAVVSTNDFTLVTDGLPANTVGLYYFGPNQVQLPAGDGFRCVGGSTFRFNPATAASPLGVSSLQVDLTAAPAVGVINSGTVFSFQHWYRDVAAGGAGFNFSNGLTVLFL